MTLLLYVVASLVPTLSATTPDPVPSERVPRPFYQVAQAGGTLHFTAPGGWVEEKPASSMRKAQYRLPGEKGGEDAQLVVFFFGPGQGGSVEANIERWYGQFEQPDGTPTAKRAKREKRTVNGLPVTIVDIRGTYRARIRMVSPTRHNKPNYRMLGAIAETPAGPWFFKLLGPEATLAKWEKSFDAFVASFRYE